MDLKQEFLNHLLQDAYTKQDIRFFTDKDKLKHAFSKISVRTFCSENRINRGSVYHMLSGKRAVPLDILEKLNLEIDGPCIVTGSSVFLYIPRELTKELGYLIGALHDGTVVRETKDEYLCAFYSKDKEFVETLKELVKHVFRIEPKIERFKDVFGIRIRSLTLYLFLSKVFEIPQYQRSWGTPKMIENASIEIQKSYISGFWDAEGVCPRIEKLDTIKKKNLYVGFVQKNKKSLEFIKGVLEANGISCGNVFWSTDKFVLKISSNSIQRFSEFIDSKHPKKGSRLKEVAKIFSAD